MKLKACINRFLPALLIVFFTVNTAAYAEETKKSTSAVQNNDVPVSILISGIGDCTLGSDVRTSTAGGFTETFEKNKKDYGYFFKNVNSLLKKDDLTLANLEGPLTNAALGMEKDFCFKGLPEFAHILKRGSVEAVNLANNHSHDYFEAGYKDTVSALKTAGVSYFGYGNKMIRTIKGIKVGVLGYKIWTDSTYSKDVIKKEIQSLRKAGVKLVIVSFHWGEEKKNYPIPLQTTYGRYTIDNGADLVLGHHSHVIQSIEKYKNKYIVYSLGNFCMGGNRNPSDKDTFIFQQKFNFKNGKQVAGSINIIPCSVSSVKERNNYQPTPLTGTDKARVIQRINEYSKNYNFRYKS